MAKTSLLFGSYQNLPSQVVTINGNAESVTASNVGIYVDHATAALSAAAQLEAAMTAAGLTNPSVQLLENLKWRIQADSTFTLVWTTSVLPTLFGFTTSDLTGASSYTSSTPSRYVWAPGRTESPMESVLGLSGARIYDTHWTIAPDGTQVATSFGHLRRNRMIWRYVAQSLYQTASELGGEYCEFFDAVLVKASKFVLHRSIEMDFATASPISIVLGDGIGPLEMDGAQSSNTAGFRREAGFEQVDAHYNVELPLVKVPEYEAA